MLNCEDITKVESDTIESVVASLITFPHILNFAVPLLPTLTFCEFSNAFFEVPDHQFAYKLPYFYCATFENWVQGALAAVLVVALQDVLLGTTM